MVRRRPDKIWDTRQVSPARKFGIPPAEPQKSQQYSGERESPRIGGYWSLCDPDGGIICTLRGGWRGLGRKSATPKTGESFVCLMFIRENIEYDS